MNIGKNIDNKRSADENIYRKNVDWLNSVNENKAKLEQKLKQEAKITDETVY